MSAGTDVTLMSQPCHGQTDGGDDCRIRIKFIKAETMRRSGLPQKRCSYRSNRHTHLYLFQFIQVYLSHLYLSVCQIRCTSRTSISYVYPSQVQVCQFWSR